MIRAEAGWEVRCDRCDHGYRTATDDRAVATGTARINGWAINDLTLCPGCATTADYSAQH
ncbi:hypothetical protein SAMN04490239_1224 [Rhodococcus koreensis]|uniref:Uncharacterized protein n=2 Tax=Rhodococcus koreensis TaxID=99653 RepID=A0A1H4LDC0_9NOCA|nr:hypothetical protein [Rhodococcus koreensis]SEB68741.1 hypothetical protein SAMN04490239_1224 [Rhodococcus koreensis]